MGRPSNAMPRLADWRATALLALCALVALVPSPLAAQSAFERGSVCHISLDADVSHAAAVADPSKWTCKGADVDWEADRHIIRHDLSANNSESENPRFAEFERIEFERLTVVVEGEDGHVVSRSFGFHDLKLGSSSLKAMVEIPDPHSRITSVSFVHDGGWFPEVLVAAELTREAEVPPIAGYLHILAALLCGLLLAPIIFDLVFFKALREPFPLYHALFCLMAGLQTAAVSGLLPMLFSLPYEDELNITFFSLDIMIAATFLFAYHFIEEGRLPRRFRRWLLLLPLITLGFGWLSTFRMELFGDWIDHVYFGVLLAVFAGYFYLLRHALLQGSRMAPYLAWGITPLALVVFAQALTVFFPSVFPEFDETWVQNFALLFEVGATALAVADRFMMLRRERDTAVSAARDLELLSEMDELTGLRNRRSLEARYLELVREGFHALAVLDLDQFKEINDIHGHPVGDRVIRSAAWALSPGDEENLAAFRIGGEEFLLLLRGDDAADIAESRRKAVTARIMAEVDELVRPVTASMGYVDFKNLSERQRFEFAALYARADKLLYAAKCDGRDCARSVTIEGEEEFDQLLRRAAA